jgi:hypothetical protein
MMTTTNKQTLDIAHRQWATRPSDERFQSLEDLAANVADRRNRSKSIDVDMDKTAIKEEAGILTVNGTITPCEPSHWAFSQLATSIGAPASYLRTLPNDLVIQNVNHGLKKTGDSVKFMTVASEELDKPNTLQAVTSTTYGRIWDADVVHAVQRIVERTSGKFYNPKAYGHKGQPDGFKTIDTSVQLPSGLYASDRDVFCFLIDGGSLLDAGPRAQLNRGFIVWNSEVGARTFGLMTFLFNTCCGNNYIFGAEQVQRLLIRHTSGGPARFDQEATPALLNYVNEAAQPIEAKIRKAQDYLLPSVSDKVEFSDVLEFVNKAAKFSKGEVTQAIRYATTEEGDCRTLWHLTQGFTAYARGLDYVDARLDLESRAGKLLNVLN